MAKFFSSDPSTILSEFCVLEIKWPKKFEKIKIKLKMNIKRERKSQARRTTEKD